MSYGHLTARERTTIFYLRQQGQSLRAIGRWLGRSHTTISRELKRNLLPLGNYWDDAAHKMAVNRRSLPRHFRRRKNPCLRDYVQECIRQDWSPEIIANRVRMDYPRRRTMRISHETIYQWVFKDAAEGGLLYQHLTRRHRKRYRKCRYGKCRGAIPGRVGIENRPDSIGRRSRFGHWEGDTVEGLKGSGGIATHVERKSRLLIAAKLQDHTAREMATKTVSLFQRIPEAWRRTLTVDNGKEFARFKTIESHTGMTVYFSNPYSPWERGTNEQTNGLLRFYFPKRTNWKAVSDHELAIAVDRLNTRPRKCLGYRTPLEVFNKYAGGALGT